MSLRSNKWRALPLYVRISFWAGVVVRAMFHGGCVLALIELYQRLAYNPPWSALIMLSGLVAFSFYSSVRDSARFVEGMTNG